MATPVTAAGGGGLVAAAELPPPQAANSNAARHVNKAQVMVFTKEPPRYATQSLFARLPRRRRSGAV
jgi:hypothetical protein